MTTICADCSKLISATITSPARTCPRIRTHQNVGQFNRTSRNGSSRLHKSVDYTIDMSDASHRQSGQSNDLIVSLARLRSLQKNRPTRCGKDGLEKPYIEAAYALLSSLARSLLALLMLCRSDFGERQGIKSDEDSSEGMIGNAGRFNGCGDSTVLLRIAAENHTIRLSILFPRVWMILEAILHEAMTPPSARG